MSISIRNRVLTFVITFVVSFILIYFAKPLSILTTCLRDSHIRCDQFFDYFREYSDGYEGYYLEYRDDWLWRMGGFILFFTGVAVVITLALDIHKNRFKSSLQKLKLNQSEIGNERKTEEKLEKESKRSWW